MKRRVVAIFLSLTLCMGGTLEAGAAALGSTDVQMAAETAGDPAEDVFSDEAETTVQQPETEADQTGSTDSTDSSEETPVTPENPAETPDVIETPEITEIPETTEAPEATEAPDATTEDSTDLTGICMKRCRKSYGCGIRTATSKCGIVIIFINALEACDHNDPAVIQLSADTCRLDLFQACTAMCTCCVHSYLKSVQRNSRYSQTVHSHGHQCH